MATKLKNLKIRKVDFVDEGANPDAHIKTIKRRDGKGQPEEGESRGDTGSILKKLFRFIGKAAGMDQEEIDSAVEDIQKGDSVSFRDKISEVNNRKIADEMWDTCYALQSSLYSILNDDDLDSTATETAMQDSLDEFYAAVQEAIRKWSSGKEASIVRKNDEVSEEDLDIMKSAVERLTETIGKACRDTKVEKAGGNEADNSKDVEGDEEEMKIDKSKLTAAERAFLDDIEKRCGTDTEDGTKPDEGGTGAPAPLPAGQAVTKSAQEQTGETPAQVAEEPGDIYKGLNPAVAAELAELRKFRERAEESELSDVAQKYEIIGKKKEELVPLLKSLKAAGGTAYADMIAILDQTVEAVEKSGIFSEIGKAGHGNMEGGAWAEAEVKAVELMKSREGLSKAQALDVVFLENPELAARCEKEE